MPSPDRTGSAARLLGCALGMAALAVACSKQERPDVTVRQTTLAGQDAGRSRPIPAESQFVSFDAASNTVTFELMAGPFNFNGFGNGQGTLTVPPKSKVGDQLRAGRRHAAQRRGAVGRGASRQLGRQSRHSARLHQQGLEGLPRGPRM